MWEKLGKMGDGIGRFAMGLAFPLIIIGAIGGAAGISGTAAGNVLGNIIGGVGTVIGSYWTLILTIAFLLIAYGLYLTEQAKANKR